MRLIFMGSPTFALPTLNALIASEHEIVAIYTQPPRPAGRGQRLTKTAIHARAEEVGLPVHHPEKLKNEALEELKQIECDAIIVVAYGLLLPQPVLDHAPCLNIHPSALPRWRGPAPLQHTLLNGDTTSEVCIMALDIGMDTGPIYTRTPLPVDENDTLETLHNRAAELGATALINVLQNWPMQPIPQSETGVTLAPKITPDMRPINWNKPANEIHNHIRSMSPIPGATANYNGETWKLRHSKVTTGTGQPGEILKADTQLIIACGDQNQGGAVEILHLQRPGKQAQDAQTFLTGTPLTTGTCFS